MGAWRHLSRYDAAQITDAKRAVPAPTFRAGLLQPGALRDEREFSEAEKDKAEDGLSVLLGGEAAVGPKLVGGGP